VTALAVPDPARVFPLVRDLHELLWHLEEVLALPSAAAAHAQAERLRASADALGGDPALTRAAVDAVWVEVAALLERASAAVRAEVPERTRGRDRRRADLVGRDLRRERLAGADLRGASLLGADLRGARLDRTDLIGADLRGANLRGTDLATALFLTPTQVAAARGDAATRLPPALPRPAHWPLPH
jgi:hypothetical protein